MRTFYIAGFLILAFLSGCESQEGLFVYAVFEYCDGDGYFFGYFLDDWGRDITDDVQITINDSRSFTPVDTSRYFLSEVYPGAQFKVKFKSPDYPDVETTVRIPDGFSLIEFDGVINSGEKDTIVWETSGELPQYWEIFIQNRESGFTWYRYYNSEDTMAIIEDNIFNFSGTYQIIIEALNFSDIDKASSQSTIVGVYSIERNYTVNR